MGFIVGALIIIIAIVCEELSLRKQIKEHEPEAKEFCERLKKNMDDLERIRNKKI